tara:strand:- start:25 stop:255 length:231 start_codon:yes stop_codon:yes gene_type:complete
MELTAAQKASLAQLQVEINSWEEQQLASIDSEFRFLVSINKTNSVLSRSIVSKIADNAESIIAALQLTGEAYSENS